MNHDHPGNCAQAPPHARTRHRLILGADSVTSALMCRRRCCAEDPRIAPGGCRCSGDQAPTLESVRSAVLTALRVPADGDGSVRKHRPLGGESVRSPKERVRPRREQPLVWSCHFRSGVTRRRSPSARTRRARGVARSGLPQDAAHVGVEHVRRRRRAKRRWLHRHAHVDLERRPSGQAPAVAKARSSLAIRRDPQTTRDLGVASRRPEALEIRQERSDITLRSVMSSCKGRPTRFRGWSLARPMYASAKATRQARQGMRFEGRRDAAHDVGVSRPTQRQRALFIREEGYAEPLHAARRPRNTEPVKRVPER